MALKAGRVGVDPSQVDMAGNIIGGGSDDSYTKSEADAKFATKASLTANDKEFTFAYDATSQKYGYKAGSDGEFVPFNGAGVVGINIPDAAMTGFTITGATYQSGGFQIVSNAETGYDEIYGDLIVLSTSGSVEIEMPVNARGIVGIAYNSTLLESVKAFRGTATDVYGTPTGSDTNKIRIDVGQADRYIRVIVATCVRTS